MCGTHARGCLIDGLPFQLLTSLKLALSDCLQCRLKTSAPTKLNLKQQTIPSPTPKPQTKILWRVIAETSLPAAHSFSLSNSPTQNRACLSNISASRAAYMDVQKQYPFETVAVCVLPNHIHTIWTLPPDDADYSLRWRLIKTKFSAHFPRAENLSASKQRRNERGIWQRRFYEHTVRNEADLQRCADYIHYNPVKHRCAASVHDWPFSSFHRYVRHGLLPPDWGGTPETADMDFGE